MSIGTNSSLEDEKQWSQNRSSKFKICKKSGAIMDIFSSFFKKTIKLSKR